MKYLRTFSKHAWVWSASIPLTVIVAVLLSLWLVGCAEYPERGDTFHNEFEAVRETRQDVRLHQCAKVEYGRVYVDLEWVDRCKGWTPI